MNTSSLLNALWLAGHLRTLDHALAQSLRRLDPATPDAVLAAAALASLAVSKGHAGLPLAEPWALLDADTGIAWPDAADWQARLAVSPWVATPEDPATVADPQAPLVLEAAPGQPALLYLRRYREYERNLALGLQRIAAHRPDSGDLSALAPLFACLFADASLPALSSPVRHAGHPQHPHDDAAQANGPQLAQAGAGHDTHECLPLPPRAEDAQQAPTQPALFPLAEEAPAAHRNPPLPPLTEEDRTGGALPADDRQARAAALALRHALLLVTGGPGTGKTTTTARLLVLLAAQAQQAGRAPPRIALAAPTGRAAERMAESVRHAVQSLAAAGIAADLLAALPTAGTTLHRLLGTIPDSPRFRHHADNPLPFDVVVVDEASMIDLPLMAKLVDAIADGTRLVLLGDPDQLPSVEAGDVLAAILAAAGEGDTLAPDDAQALHLLLGPSHRRPRAGGDPARSGTAETRPLAPHLPADDEGRFPGIRIHLQRGWRQRETLHLAPLAAAVRQGDADSALTLLREGRLSNVHFHEALADPLEAQRDPLLAHWRALGEAATPSQALALSTRLRLLTAVREGPQGARTLNARIEHLLAHAGGPARAGQGHFHGQPLIVTENSYRHRLFNGDIGLCFRDAQGVLVAWFPGGTPDAPRAFHPAALPAHESAFAMTVHKAQGSEFDTVWLLLPARGNRVLSRELVYTGITRARRELHVAGSEAVIREALGRHASRWSGLGWRLGC